MISGPGGRATRYRSQQKKKSENASAGEKVETLAITPRIKQHSALPKTLSIEPKVPQQMIYTKSDDHYIDRLTRARAAAIGDVNHFQHVKNKADKLLASGSEISDRC